ncbi:MAG: hypothetical protein AB7F43_08950 [Bacteriovoracia bacterium]
MMKSLSYCNCIYFLIGVFFFVLTVRGHAASVFSDRKSPVFKKKEVPYLLPRKMECNGRFGSPSCVNWFYVNSCKNYIEFRWAPLKKPGTSEWAKRFRNYCSVTWNAENSIEEKKLKPSHCERIVKYFQAAINDFPEMPIEWPTESMGTEMFEQAPGKEPWDSSTLKTALTPCSYSAFAATGSRDGVLFSRQFSRSEHKIFSFALRFEDVAQCHIKYKREQSKRARVQTREMICPELAPGVKDWLEGFLKELGLRLVVENA